MAAKRESEGWLFEEEGRRERRGPGGREASEDRSELTIAGCET